MSLTNKLSRRSKTSTFKLSAAAFFEKLEEKIKSRKKIAMDFTKADLANVIAYNEREEEKRIAEMAKYRGYAQLIDAPLQEISKTTGSQFDTDKYYALLTNQDLRNEFLDRIKGVRLDEFIEAQSILNAIQVKGTGSFENKEAVIRELSKPRYKKITKPIKAETPFGIGEKSFLREQQAFIESQTGGRPELFSRPGVPEGIRRTDIAGTFVDPSILTGGTASSFRTNFKKAEADSLRNYILSFKKGVDFTISDVLPTVPATVDPIVNYIGIKDVKARRAAKDKVRADLLKNSIKPLLTANGEIAVEYVSIIQGSGLFSGAVDAKGEKVPSFTDEPLEGRTRVKLNDYYLKELGLIDKESEVTGAETDDKGKDDTGAGVGADPNKQKDTVITSVQKSEEYNKRKEDFDSSKDLPSPFKDFVVKNFGYDKPPSFKNSSADKAEETYEEDLNKMKDFVAEQDTKGRYTLSKNEVDIFIDQIMNKYNIEDNEENRERVKEHLFKGLRVYQTQETQEASDIKQFNNAQEYHREYIKKIKKYKSAKEFDDDEYFRSQAGQHLVEANIEYTKQIKKLKDEIDSLSLSKIKERNELKGRLLVLEREYQEVQEMQSILRTRPRVPTDIDPNSTLGL